MIEEYAEEIAISQGSEEGEEQHIVQTSLQYPVFPSEQLLQAISKTIEVALIAEGSCRRAAPSCG